MTIEERIEKLHQAIQLAKNDCHVPSGPKGGQFCSGGGGKDDVKGGMGGSKHTNAQANFYSVVGGYRGAYKSKGKWVGVKEFNRHPELKPKNVLRWQGPPSKAILEALRNPSH